MLAVGTLEPRKNLARVVEATRASPASSCASSARRGLGRRRRATASLARLRLDDERLAELYRGARCLVYPSLLRGLRHPRARGDGVRHAGRDERGRRAARRPPAARPCSSTRSTRTSIAAGIAEADRAAGRAACRAGSARAASSPGAAADAARGAPGGEHDVSRSSSSTRTCSAGAGPATRRTSRICSARWRRSPAPASACGGHSASGARAGTGSSRSRCGRRSRSRGCSGRCRGCSAAWAPRSCTRSTPFPLRSPCPAVVTIHDLSFEDPAPMGRKDRLVFRARRPARRAAARPRADRLGAHEARPRRPLRPADGRSS